MLSSAVFSDRCKSENAYNAVPVQIISNSVCPKSKTLAASQYTFTNLALYFCDNLFTSLSKTLQSRKKLVSSQILNQGIKEDYLTWLKLFNESNNWHLLSTVPTVCLPLFPSQFRASFHSCNFYSEYMGFFQCYFHALQGIWDNLKTISEKNYIKKSNQKIWKEFSSSIHFVKLLTSCSIFYGKMFKVKDKGKKALKIIEGSNRIIFWNIGDVSGKAHFIICFPMDFVLLKLNSVS